MKRLFEIGEHAALNASRALSKLVDRPVKVEILSAEVKKVEELSLIIGPEETVAGIHLPITGDVLGASLLILLKEAALTLCDVLAKRESGTARKLTKRDESGLREVGNIISAHFVAAFSNILRVNIREHMPSFDFDIFRSLLGRIITRFARNTEKALIVEIELIFIPVRLSGYFLLLFERENVHEILDALVRQ